MRRHAKALPREPARDWALRRWDTCRSCRGRASDVTGGQLFTAVIAVDGVCLTQ